MRIEVFLVVVGLWCARGAKHTKVDIVRTIFFGNCDEGSPRKPHMNYFENITITNVGRGRNVFNGYFVLKRNISSIYSVYHVFKCETESESSCQSWTSTRKNDYCAVVVEDGQFWTPIWFAFSPRVKCPLQQNVYKITNGTMDASKLMELRKTFPLVESRHWMSKSNLYDQETKRKFACMKIIIELAQIRI